MSIVTLHLALNSREGEFHRAQRLIGDICDHLLDKPTEILLTKATDLFKLHKTQKLQHSSRIRILLPILLPMSRHQSVRRTNNLICKICGWILGRILKPKFIIGETHSAFAMAASIAAWNKDCLLLMDLHGAFPEETLYCHKGMPSLDSVVSLLNQAESQIIRCSSLVICASSNLMSHLQVKHDAIVHKFCVYQCGVDTSLFRYSNEARRTIRAQIGLNETEFVFVYCGGFHRWQLIEEMFAIYREIQRLKNSDHRLLILTAEPEANVKQLALQLGCTLEQIIVCCVKHEEVPNYLSAADAAFLLREDTILNRVACPTKLGEYLACGLPVITSEVAKTWPWLNGSNDVACIVDFTDPAVTASTILRHFNNDGGFDREKVKISAVAIAQEQLSSERDTIEISRCLKELMRLVE